MRINYRPEIDGLRAIAVIAVILHHTTITIFGYQPFKGGFIGVDIFFVISGYLITSIIIKELVTTDKFSFKYFYERRIRRILPVLLLVILVSLPFAWIYLIPSQFIDFSKSILYSLGFSSNFYFWYSGQQYGAESSLFKPFLHTWSLSVEEQYYILFPIVLFITFKFFRKYLLTILVIGFLISILLADWGSRNSPVVTFYFLPTRMFELLIGSILSYFEIKLDHRSKNQILNIILPNIGLLLIGHSILFFNDKMFHPSFYTLSPIIGVCLIIWFSQKDELITKILSSKLFVGVGLISYSLYLWHYPVFAFARIIEFTQDNILKKLLLAVIILLLSIISYYFIERPARNRKYKFKIIFSSVILSCCVLITLNSNIIIKNGYKHRLPEILDIGIEKNLRDEKTFMSCGSVTLCFSNLSSNKKIYIIGDSHTASLTYNLKDKIVDKKYQFITSTKPGCIYLLGFDKIDSKTNKIDINCNNKYFSKLEETLSKETNSIIIFGGRFSSYLAKNFISSNGKYESIQTSFKSSVLQLSKNNKIILIYPLPEVDWHVPKKLFTSLPKKVDLIKDYLVPENYITTSYEVYKNKNKSSFELLNSIKGNNIYRVYPHKLFCDTIIKDKCITHDDKNVFYRDSTHPSVKGAEMINDLIMIEIEKIELKTKQ